MSLFEILRKIPDHWRAEGKRFDLATVLLYAILGMVAGAIKTAEQFLPTLGRGPVSAGQPQRGIAPTGSCSLPGVRGY